MSGTKRTVKGNKEVAKCVAKSWREHVAWSIEAAFPVVGTELVIHGHFTGEAPHLTSDHPPEAADSSRVVGENPGKRARTRGTDAIAPPRTTATTANQAIMRRTVQRTPEGRRHK